MRLGLGLGVDSITSQKIGAGFTGILDEYSGAAAAYSVRRLSSSYTDSLIRVRRSSDDTEQDIGFDANGDLDTTALLAFVGSQNLADWSENFGNFSLPSNVTLTSGVTDPFGGTDATDLTSASDAWLLRDSLSHIQSGAQYTVSIYARAKTAGVKNGFRFIMGTAASSNIEATTTWTRYTATMTANGTACGIYRTSPNSFAEIEIYGFQINEGTSAQSYATTSGTYLAGDGAVTTFYDQSGNGNDATNSTASEQPLVMSGGTLVEENGKAAIDLDGTDDSFTANALAGLSRLDIFFVHQTTDSQYVHFNSVAALTERGFTAQDTNGTSGLPSNMGTPTMYNNGTQFTGTTRDDVHTAQNGHQVISYIDADTTAFSTFEIGGHGSFVFDGKFQELIAFNSDQSSNRTGIETNINDHFSIYP